MTNNHEPHQVMSFPYHQTPLRNYFTLPYDNNSIEQSLVVGESSHDDMRFTFRLDNGVKLRYDSDL
jgi:hypothetical protein